MVYPIQKPTEPFLLLINMQRNLYTGHSGLISKEGWSKFAFKSVHSIYHFLVKQLCFKIILPLVANRRKSADMAKFLDLSQKQKINIFRLLRKVPEGGKIWIKLLNRKHAELAYYIMKKNFQTKFPTFFPKKFVKCVLR